jgi:hypothetical protein
MASALNGSVRHLLFHVCDATCDVQKRALFTLRLFQKQVYPHFLRFSSASFSGGCTTSSGWSDYWKMNWRGHDTDRSWPVSLCYPTTYMEGLRRWVKHFRHDSGCHGRDLNRSPPSYKSEAVPPEPSCSLTLLIVPMNRNCKLHVLEGDPF